MSDAKPTLDRALAKVRGKKMLSGEEFDALAQALEAHASAQESVIARPPRATGRLPSDMTPATLVDFRMPKTVQGNAYEHNGRLYEGWCRGVRYDIFCELVRMYEGDWENRQRLRTAIGNQPGTQARPDQFHLPPIPVTLHKGTAAA